MKKRNIPFILLITAMIFALGCKKKETPGPVGPKGATGPAGPKGEPGPAGKNGADANVITKSFNIKDSAWTDAGTIYTYSIAVPELTSELVNKGAVQMYVLINSQWSILPHINGKGVITKFSYNTGNVTLTNFIPSSVAVDLPSTSTYKLVIISNSSKQ